MRGQLNVLVVDDEFQIREGFRHYVPWNTLNLHLVDCVSNGEKALSLFETIPIDILITDIELPKLNGLDLIERLIADNYNPAVLIISGYDNFQYAKRAIRFNIVYDYILKPIDMPSLVGLLDKIANEYSKNNSAFTMPSIQSLDFDQWIVANNLNNLDLFSKTQPFMQMGNAPLCCMALEEGWNKLTALNPPDNFLNRYCASYSMSLTNFLIEKSIVSSLVFGDEDPVKQLSALHNAAELYKCINTWSETACRLTELKNNTKGTALITAAVKLTYSNYLNNDFSLQWLSEKLGVSPNYLSTKFKEEMHIPFIRHVNQLKMEHAKMLLKDVNLKVYEVADKVGIEDYRYFTKLFKEVIGVSPLEFRNSL